MTDFYVEVETIVVETYLVSATDVDEAVDRYESGEATLIDEYTNTSVDAWKSGE